jgi:mono/diheme cytochrome c family protein
MKYPAADARAFANKHSFKLMVGGLLCLLALCLGRMTPYWRGQLAKYNHFLSTPGAVPVSLSGLPSAQMLAQGKLLYENNCIGCHGKDAGGQDPLKPLGGTYPDGMYYAPALNATGHTAVHTTNSLFFVAKYGSMTNADSAMRGWEGRLSDEELASVVQWFRSTWPVALQRAQGSYPNTRFP